MKPFSENSVENFLRAELADADALVGAMGPILRHLCANDDHSLFSDEIIARLRGTMGDVARQLLHAQAEAAALVDPMEFIEERRGGLVEQFLANSAFLSHAHALAIEWQLAEKLQSRNTIDPVLTPLLSALVASSDAKTAEAAMQTLAAQARFVQSQRRMELPLGELPGDLFHNALLIMRAKAAEGEDDAAQKAQEALRSRFDESRSRLGLMSRLVSSMGGGAMAALSVGHAGVSIFVTALALASSQDRDLVIFSTNDRQLARLALSLRAAGLKLEAVKEQFLYLHPEVELPSGLDRLRADHAAALLASSTPFPVE